MNVLLFHHVMSMQHVTTQKDLTSVHVILGTVVTDLHAMVGDMIYYNFSEGGIRQ